MAFPALRFQRVGLFAGKSAEDKGVCDYSNLLLGLRFVPFSPFFTCMTHARERVAAPVDAMDEQSMRDLLPKRV